MVGAIALSSALLFCVTTRAQSGSPQNGDDLYWIGNNTQSWTDPALIWYDEGAGSSNPVQGPVSISNATSNTYGFFFIGNNSSGGTTYGTVAPTGMGFSQTLYANYISFLDGFNSTNTTTIGRTVNDSLANPLNMESGWEIADRGVGGTVTFQQYAPGVTPSTFGGMYINLDASGSIVAVTGSNVVINTNVTGSGGLTIDKPPTDNGAGGTVTLQVNNNNGNEYTGGTTVNAGTLVIANPYSSISSATGTGPITVNSGGTLAGHGLALGNTTINTGGVLSPGTGSSPGILTVGSNQVGGGLTIHGTLDINISGGGTTAGVNYSQVDVLGSLTLDATSARLVVNALNPSALQIGQKFDIVLDNGSAPTVGFFSGLPEGSTVTDSAGDTYKISYLDNGDGGTVPNDVSLTVESLAVPEPSTVASFLAGSSLIGLGMFVRRRRS